MASLGSTRPTYLIVVGLGSGLGTVPSKLDLLVLDSYDFPYSGAQVPIGQACRFDCYACLYREYQQSIRKIRPDKMFGPCHATSADITENVTQHRVISTSGIQILGLAVDNFRHVSDCFCGDSQIRACQNPDLGNRARTILRAESSS